MLACSKFFIRIGAAASIRQLNSGVKAATSNRNNFICISVAATLVSSSASNSTNAGIPAHTPSLACSSADVGVNKVGLSQVDATYCGFAKNLISAPSCVIGCNVFGDDACFIAKYKSTHVTGVADGVGGWRNYGVDPSEFSSGLMKLCAEIVEDGGFEPTRPDLIIQKAFNRLKAAPRPIGSSTACVLIVHQKILYSANLGDSGYLVFRKGKVIQRSKEQVHYFNAPFQLTLLPEECELEGVIMDRPDQADLNALPLESGDFILLATDGLWDNVPESTIIDVLAEADPASLQATCNSIALIARRLSRDEQYASPFAVKAGHHGIRTVGGKPDDITLVLLYVS